MSLCINYTCTFTTENSIVLIIIGLLTVGWMDSTNSSRLLRIREEVTAGTVLIPNLIDYLNERPKSDQTADVHFQAANENTILAIGNSAMPGVDWFYIDSVSQSLVVRTPPDRDVLCPTKFLLPETFLKTSHGGIEFPDYVIGRKSTALTQTECLLKLSIVYGSASNPYFDFISIILEDVNDHAPTFVKVKADTHDDNRFIINIQEDTSDSTVKDSMRIQLPIAEDPDEGLNSIRGFRLEGNDASLFQLDISQVDDPYATATERDSRPTYMSYNKLYLVPMNTMSMPYADGFVDHEKRSQYQLDLIAYDGGTPHRTSLLPILIVVEDLNDHRPIFNREWYSGQIMENVKPGQSIFEFSATDADSEPNNRRINFRIPQTRPNSHTQQSMSDTQAIAAKLFSIETIPRNFPDMSQGSTALTNQPNSTHGRLIIRHQPDVDIQKAAKEAIAITKNQPKSRLPETLRINSGISHENSPIWFDFHIEAFDHGKPHPLKTHVPVYINIIDINDHPPKIFISYMQPTTPSFSRTLSHPVGSWGSVKENLARAMVAQITVTDEDAVDGELEISCTTNDDRFVLEDIAEHSHALASHQLKILNSIPYQEGLMESNTRSHGIGSIDSRMFKLMLVRQLDREASEILSNAIEFLLTCTDNIHDQLPGGQLSTRAHVKLVVEDTNDNPPVFSQTHYTLHVPENHPHPNVVGESTMHTRPKFFVGQVHATDPDEGINGNINYVLASDAHSAFEIESGTGKLYLLKAFDREATSEIKLKVLAIDGQYANESGSKRTHTIQLTATANVRVMIDDLNDCAPKFLETTYHFQVEEGIDLAIVGQVTATDSDKSDSITYRLSVGSSLNTHDSTHDTEHQMSKHSYDEALELTSHFQIDPTSGTIRLKGRLDRERRAHYDFIVLAIDNSLNVARKQKELIQYTATATILITVLDQNDNAPQVLSPRNHAEFILEPAQSIAGNTIFTIQATDADLGENGTVEYQLLEVNNELNRWMLSSASTMKPHTVNEVHNDTETSEQTKFSALHSGLKTHIPFAVDQTAGICYLKENLPPLDSNEPRIFLLRIRVYDLGRPVSLNNTVVVRIIRKSLYSGASTSQLSDKMGMNELGHRMQETGLVSMSNEVAGPWEGFGQAQISDRTMIVILSTVFILLLLTTIVLLLLIRYRRLFLRNYSFPDAHLHESPLNKANMGFTAGKPPSLELYSSRSSAFPEVFTAPWVNQNLSPSDSPNLQSYPNPHNQPNTSSRLSANRPFGCWSPTVCHNVNTQDGSATLGTGCHYLNFSNSPKCPHDIQLFALKMREKDDRGRCAMEEVKKFGFLHHPSNKLNGDESIGVVIENMANAQEDSNEYGVLTGDSAMSNSMKNRTWTFEQGSHFPNNWIKTDYKRGVHDTNQTLRRIAISLENLNSDRYEAGNSKHESDHEKQSHIRNEYQPLITQKWNRTGSGELNYKQTTESNHSLIQGHSPNSIRTADHTPNKSALFDEKFYQPLMSSSIFLPSIVQTEQVNFASNKLSPSKPLPTACQYIQQPPFINFTDKSRMQKKPRSKRKQLVQLRFAGPLHDRHPVVTFDQETANLDAIPVKYSVNSPVGGRRNSNKSGTLISPKNSPTLRGSFV